MSASKREKASMRPLDTVKKLLARAENAMEEVEKAHVMTSNNKREYPTFDAAEVKIGATLGVGGFGIVSEVASLNISVNKHETPGVFQQEGAPSDSNEDDQDHDNDDHYELDTAKEKMTRRCRRFGKARYAIKRLDPALSELERTRGMIDMALEVKYLSVLWHPNIVKMRAVCSGDLMRPDAFFLMDRLYDTLERQIKAWAKHKQSTSSMFGFKKDKLARHHILVERFIVAYDLAVAFAYIHENKLVYRDIKQENFGFDIRGDIKVFDFGLTKALTPSRRAKKSKMYNLTPITGSFPYMAPEVAMKVPYDERCDCFSFAFLLHEILALRNTPYHGYTPKEYFQRVIKSHERPPIRRTWPNMAKEVIKKSWDFDPEKRPQMKSIAKMLREDLNEMSRDENVLNRTKHMVERSSRSATFSVQKEER